MVTWPEPSQLCFFYQCFDIEVLGKLRDFVLLKSHPQIDAYIVLMVAGFEKQEGLNKSLV